MESNNKGFVDIVILYFSFWVNFRFHLELLELNGSTRKTTRMFSTQLSNPLEPFQDGSKKNVLTTKKKPRLLCSMHHLLQLWLAKGSQACDDNPWVGVTPDWHQQTSISTNPFKTKLIPWTYQNDLRYPGWLQQGFSCHRIWQTLSDFVWKF